MLEYNGGMGCIGDVHSVEHIYAWREGKHSMTSDPVTLRLRQVPQPAHGAAASCLTEMPE